MGFLWFRKKSVGTAPKNVRQTGVREQEPAPAAETAERKVIVSILSALEGDVKVIVGKAIHLAHDITDSVTGEVKKAEVVIREGETIVQAEWERLVQTADADTKAALLSVVEKVDRKLQIVIEDLTAPKVDDPVPTLAPAEQSESAP